MFGQDLPPGICILQNRRATAAAADRLAMHDPLPLEFV
jgi:hypothetical protein